MTNQEHLLACLSEECAEVIKNVNKALRFGLEDRHPDKTETNFELISHELNDVYGVIELLGEYGVCFTLNSMQVDAKKKKVSATWNMRGQKEPLKISNPIISTMERMR